MVLEPEELIAFNSAMSSNRIFINSKVIPALILGSITSLPGLSIVAIRKIKANSFSVTKESKVPSKTAPSYKKTVTRWLTNGAYTTKSLSCLFLSFSAANGILTFKSSFVLDFISSFLAGRVTDTETSGVPPSSITTFLQLLFINLFAFFF